MFNLVLCGCFVIICWIRWIRCQFPLGAKLQWQNFAPFSQNWPSAAKQEQNFPFFLFFTNFSPIFPRTNSSQSSNFSSISTVCRIGRLRVKQLCYCSTGRWQIFSLDTDASASNSFAIAIAQIRSNISLALNIFLAFLSRKCWQNFALDIDAPASNSFTIEQIYAPASDSFTMRWSSTS